MELITKSTALQKSDADIKEILDYKIAEFESKGINIENGLCDYLGFAFDGIDNDINQLKEYKKLITDEIASKNRFKDNTKQKVANYIQSMGATKLNGIKYSSVTFQDSTPETTKAKTKKVYLLDKGNEEHIEITFDMALEILISQGLVYEHTISTTEIVPQKEATIRINKKRGK